MRAILLFDTTSDEKRRDFEDVFGNRPDLFFLHTLSLPCLRAPQADEIKGSTEGNLAQKHHGITGRARAILEQFPQLFFSEIAATRGWIGRATTERLAQGKNAPLPNDLWERLAEEAASNNFGTAWQNLLQLPVFVLNDDSRASLWLAGEVLKIPLTFRLLETLTAGTDPDPALIQLRETITDVAGYMWNARLATGDETPVARTGASREEHWQWYLAQHGDEPLLGPDGSLMTDLMGPHRTFDALHALLDAAAIYHQMPGVSGEISSCSCVSATNLRDGNTYTAQAETNYALLPRAKARTQGTLLLPDIFLCDPATGMTVRQHQDTRTPNTPPLLARERALRILLNKMNTPNLCARAPTQLKGPSAELSVPLGERDTVALVLPDAASSTTEAEFTRALQAAVGTKVHVARYSLHDVVHTPEIASELQTSAIVCMVDPALVQEVKSAALATAILDFVILGLNREIDGTVGNAAWAGNPTFVIGAPADSDSGAGRLQTVISGLYTHGRAKNSAQLLWVGTQNIDSKISAYLETALVRPADDVITPLSSPLKDSPAVTAPGTATAPPLVVALYGGAKPLAHPQDVRDAHRAMSIAIQAQAKGVRTLHLQGAPLRTLGRFLGILPPEGSDDHNARTRYQRRLHTAVVMMPGVQAECCRAGILYVLQVPVLHRPVIFVHGGGEHPYESTTPSAPTNNVMGTFSGGAYLAMIGDQVTFVGTYGISTLPLMQLEGRPGATPRASQFAVAPHGTIAERTRMTRFPFADGRHADCAIAIIGSSGIGTLQECISFENPLLLVARQDDPIASEITQLRDSVGFRTTRVDPCTPDFERTIRNTVTPTTEGPSLPCVDPELLNSRYPVIPLAWLSAHDFCL